MCASGDRASVQDVWLVDCAFMHQVCGRCACRRWSADIGVREGTAEVFVYAGIISITEERKAHRKLNIAHFLFKLLEPRRRLWRWQRSRILMSYCTCVGDMKQPNKECVFRAQTQKECRGISCGQKSS